jgi:5-methyltetrahydrofolate--homocysteine methyltransferase
MSREELYASIIKAVGMLAGDKLGELIKTGMDSRVEAIDLINHGLTPGLRELGERFSREECFIPELIMGAKLVTQQIDRLKPYLGKDKRIASKGIFVVGTVAGDIHDLGKSLVALMLSTSGYEVVDLGTGVPNETFVQKVSELNPKWLGMSSLLTTSMPRQKEVIELLERKGIRNKIHVMVGGAPVSQYWAEEIGADAYAADPVGAVKKADEV